MNDLERAEALKLDVVELMEVIGYDEMNLTDAFVDDHYVIDVL